jgi:hypothetical protein
MNRPPTNKDLIEQAKSRQYDATKAMQTTAELEASVKRKPPAPKPQATTNLPVPKPNPTALATIVERPYRDRYLDEIAPANIVGRLIKFSKAGEFATIDDGEKIPAEAEFTVLADQTAIGWIKFNGEDAPPDREMGLLYDGFVLPLRDTLGDLDQSKWDTGLDNLPQDPWQHFIYLVLQSAATAELYTFSTSSKTGRRAVGNLLRHFDRMRKTHPSDLPRVRLSAGGFEHKNKGIGWVAVPLFIVVGRTPRDAVASPEPTTTADYLNDALPDNLK